MDVLRVIATWLVVLLHVNADLLGAWQGNAPLSWHGANVHGSLTRMAVPLFFMLSGALLVSRQESIGHVLRHRVVKIAIPLLAWSWFYMLWKHGFTPADWPSWKGLVALLMHANHYHLWFLYAMLGIYLCLPLLRAVMRENLSLGWYLIALWWLSQSILPWLQRTTGEGSNLVIPMAVGSIGYVALGHLLKHTHATPVRMRLAVITFVAAWLFTVLGTWWMTSRQGGHIYLYLYLGESLNILLMACSAFFLCQHISHQPRIRVWLTRHATRIRHLASTSLGIFLLHPAIIDVLKQGLLLPALPLDLLHPVIGPLIFATVVYLVCHLIVWLLQRIPLIRATVPA